MLTHWLSSWYTTQQQEPFNDQYEATEGEWVQILTPDKRKHVETNDPSPEQQVTKQEISVMKPEEPAVIETKEKETEEKKKEVSKKIEEVPKKKSKPEEVVTEKGLSRQEKRAMARLAEREKKKQARNAAMLLGRRGKNISTNCLPGTPLIVE